MAGWWRWSIWAVVVLGHLGVLFWLAKAMQPLQSHPPEEVVTWVEWVERAPEPPPAAETSPEPEAASTPDDPPVRRPRVTRRESAPMQAVIEPLPDDPLDSDAPREFVSPERDPFSRSTVDPDAARFGRRDLPSLPEIRQPRIAGERPVDALLPEYRALDRSPKRIVEAVASFLGGGPNAPIEAPCGGRMSGGDFTAESFSPLWQQRYGCGDKKQGAGFDGRFDQPPGTVGSR